MPTQIDTITPMNRITIQVDMRSEAVKQAVQTYAATRGLTMSALVMSSLAAQHPELGQVMGQVMAKAVVRKPDKPAKAKVKPQVKAKAKGF